MGSTLQWIEKVFRALILRNAAGADMPAEPALKIIGATLADDSANGQTVLTVGQPAIYRETGGFNVTDTSGSVYVGLHTLTADATVKAPAAPTLGMRITIKLEDTSLDNHQAIFDANGGTVTGPEATGGTYTITKAEWGDGTVSGPSVDFVCVDLTTTPVWMAT